MLALHYAIFANANFLPVWASLLTLRVRHKVFIFSRNPGFFIPSDAKIAYLWQYDII